MAYALRERIDNTSCVKDNEKTNKKASMKERIEKKISCLQKLKDNEKEFKDKMNDFMKRTNLFNYEVTIQSLVEEAEKELKILKEKVDNMDIVLDRKEVVITIFGSVSVGKSYLMNVLVNEKLFLSSAAHSTSCFVRLTKGDDNCVKIGDKKLPFKNAKDMSAKINELSSSLRKTNNTLENNEMLQIIIKETSSPILKNNVVIVDTPGADRNVDIHGIIKDQSKNSDIFIFILNCNITDVDRDFFRFQTESSVRPDIFIIVNKWDNSDADEEQDTEDSKKNITEECSNFIRNQKGGNMQNVESQIYFISTREILGKRTNLPNYQNLTLKQKQRYDEFVKFEGELQKYIDNPEENKHRRFKCDIEEVEKKIERIRVEFKNTFTQWMKTNLGDISHRLDNFMSEIKELKKNIKTCIDEEIENFKNSDLNLSNDPKELNEKYKVCCERAHEKLIEIDKKCEKKISSLTEIENSNSLLKKRINIEMKVLLKKSPSVMWYVDIVKELGSLFIGLKITKSIEIFKSFCNLIKRFWGQNEEETIPDKEKKESENEIKSFEVFKSFCNLINRIWGQNEEETIPDKEKKESENEANITGKLSSVYNYFFSNEEENKKKQMEQEQELIKQINSLGNDIYTHYENKLNVIDKEIEEGIKYLKDYRCKLYESVIELI